MRGTTICVVACFLISSVVLISNNPSSANSVLVPTSGESVTWQEYVWGGMSSEVTTDGVTISGTYLSGQGMPGTGDWNVVMILSDQIYTGDIELSANVTVTQWSGWGMGFVIGVRLAAPITDYDRNCLAWGNIIDPGWGTNCIGCRQKSVDGSFGRINLDSSPVSVSMTHEYKIAVGNSSVSYYLDGLFLYSEPLPYPEFSLFLLGSVVQDTSTATSTFEDITVKQVDSLRQVSIPTHGMNVKWQEQEYGSLSSAILPDGVQISGSYDGSETVPGTGGFNGYSLISDVEFSGDLVFSANMSIDSVVGTEFSSGIAVFDGSAPIGSPNPDFIDWASYFYSGSGESSVGYYHERANSVERAFAVDPTDIATGRTIEYKMVISGGTYSYYIDGELMYSESAAMSSVRPVFHTDIKYSGTSISVAFKDVTVRLLTNGTDVHWQEHSWGDFASQPTANGVTVAGSFTGIDLVPNGGGFNGWMLRSQEHFTDPIEFSADVTMHGFAGDEVFVGLGVQAPGTMDHPMDNALLWGPYYYADAAWNAIGYRSSYVGGVLDRQFPDDTDIVVGSTLTYKMVVESGTICYFINGVMKYSEPMPFESFGIFLYAGAKYTATSVSTEFSNVFVHHGPTEFTPHGAISITSNSEFTAANGVTSGSGTPSKPYVIEGWEIANEYLAITVSNTDAWFVIRGVFVHGGTGGIYFYSVQNGAIENATAANFAHAGIAVWSSYNICIANSRALNNGHEGIIFRDSSSLNLTGNRISGNVWQGIMLERCIRSWVIDNVIEGNVLEKDSAGYPYQAGIALFSCSGVETYHNSIVQPAQTSAYDNSPGYNAWDSGYPMGGNYWSEWIRPDANGDGIVDNSYSIPTGNLDNYPLTNYPWAYNCTIHLLAGWNFVSIPLVDFTCNARTLGLAAGDMVCKWNSSLQRYSNTYIVNISPPSRDFKIEASTGYFIWAMFEETLNLVGNHPDKYSNYSIPLDVPAGGGWVNVGWTSFDSSRHAIDLASYVSGTHAKLVCKLNSTTKRYDSYLVGISPPACNFEIVPGDAVWIWIDSPGGVLTYAPRAGPHPAVEITKTADKAGAAVGELVTFDIVVTNPATADVWLNGTVTDALLGMSWPFVDLMPGETFEQKVAIAMPDGDEFVNTATVTATDYQGHEVSATSLPVRVDIVHGAIEISKTSNMPSAAVGELIVWTITVTNPASSDVWFDGTFTDPALGKSWTFYNLMPGQSVVETVEQYMPDVDYFENWAYVTAHDHEMHIMTASASAVVYVVHPDAMIVKSASTPSAVGELTIWTITVTNPVTSDLWKNGGFTDSAIGKQAAADPFLGYNGSR